MLSTCPRAHRISPSPDLSVRKNELVIYITDSATAQAHNIVRLVAEGPATDRLGGVVRFFPRGAARRVMASVDYSVPSGQLL